MDFRLELGTLSETVEAVASSPMISTEDLTIGTVIENRRIVELPLNGRNFLKMVELTPNVSASFSGSGSSGPRQGGDRSDAAALDWRRPARVELLHARRHQQHGRELQLVHFPAVDRRAAGIQGADAACIRRSSAASSAR